jgi:hypothetical protein
MHKCTNVLCGQNVAALNVTTGSTYRNHWTLKGYNKYRLVNADIIGLYRLSYVGV